MKTKFTLTIATALAVACSVSLGADQPNKFQERTITVSNVTYTVRYELKSTTSYSRPLTNPLGQPHYDCTTTTWQGTNQIGKIESQWTENGCFEDNPMLVVGAALNWKRYPNDSAGPGMHWVVSGGARWAEKD